MNLKSPRWFPIAVVASVLNVVAIWFATGSAWHATIHGALAASFGIWAGRLQHQLRRGDGQVEAGLEAMELEMDQLRQQLGEAQERLDFAERVLAKEAQPRPR